MLGIGLAVGTDSISAQTVPAVTEEEAEVFVALDPTRIMDTRIDLGKEGPLQPDSEFFLDIGGAGVVPDFATSVGLNTAIPASATSDSFITIWPTDGPDGPDRPLTAANNADPGQPVPNFTQAKLGPEGGIGIYNERGETNFVIDVVGYFVSLSDVDGGAGSRLLSGDGAPDDALGNDGDFYVDETTGQFYVKVDGSYIATGTPTAATDSAYGAYNELGADADLVSDEAIAFDVDGAVIGDDIERVDADTFTVNSPGVYEISYRVSTTAGSGLGTTQVEVNGVPTGPESTIVLAGASLTDTVTVDALAGDTIEAVGENTDILPLQLAAGNSATITIELIAVEPPA